MQTSLHLFSTDFAAGELLRIYTSGENAFLTTDHTSVVYPRDRFLSAAVAYLRAEGFDVQVPGARLDAAQCLERVRDFVRDERDRGTSDAETLQYLVSFASAVAQVEELIDDILRVQE